MEVVSGQGDRPLRIASSQGGGDRGMFVDAAERQARRFEGRDHERRTSQQFSEKARQLGIIQQIDEHQVKLAGEPDRRGAIASLNRGPFLFEMSLEPIKHWAARPARQFRNDAGLEHTMSEIDPADLFDRRVGNEHAPLRNGLEPALGN